MSEITRKRGKAMREKRKQIRWRTHVRHVRKMYIIPIFTTERWVSGSGQNIACVFVNDLGREFS